MFTFGKTLQSKYKIEHKYKEKVKPDFLHKFLKYIVKNFEIYDE